MNTDSTMTVEKSTHKVEVIKVDKLLKHENADSLSKVKVYDYTSVVRTADWKEGDLAAWIPPDSEVEVARPEFAFLAKKAKHGLARIRTEKLRGIVSYGLLVHAPAGASIGDNVADILGVTHWEPQIGNEGLLTGGEVAKPPSGVFPKYDVDAFLHHGRKVFVPGELVAVTEKIHGASSRFVYKNDTFYCGSRGEWKKEYPSKPNVTFEQVLLQFNNDEAKAKNAWRKIENWKPAKNLWWIAADNTPSVKAYCMENPGFAVYGETYGQVQDLNYGVKSVKETRFAAFDILRPDGTWMDFPEFMATVKKYGIPQCPVIHEAIPFDFDSLVKMAEGNSTIPGADHIREGVVVHPIKERWDEQIGRVQLKIINPEY